jgi:heme-degrading monooxygenase HmoA
MIALVFAYETDDGGPFEDVYGAGGSWAAFFREAPGYVGTELLQDIEQPGRYLVVDRWESRDAYNRFIERHRDEYMRRVDETAFLYRQELRLGTFENLWTEERAGHPTPP